MTAAELAPSARAALTDGPTLAALAALLRAAGPRSVLALAEASTPPVLEGAVRCGRLDAVVLQPEALAVFTRCSALDAHARTPPGPGRSWAAVRSAGGWVVVPLAWPGAPPRASA